MDEPTKEIGRILIAVAAIALLLGILFSPAIKQALTDKFTEQIDKIGETEQVEEE